MTPIDLLEGEPDVCVRCAAQWPCDAAMLATALSQVIYVIASLPSRPVATPGTYPHDDLPSQEDE